MIKIINVKYNSLENIELSFSDSSQGVFNLQAYLEGKDGTLLQPLHNEAYAKRLFIDAGALCWPNGLELAPARLYELSNAKKVA